MELNDEGEERIETGGDADDIDLGDSENILTVLFVKRQYLGATELELTSSIVRDVNQAFDERAGRPRTDLG